MTQWLTMRFNGGEPVTCPYCRADMSKPNLKEVFTILRIKFSSLVWALGNQQPPVAHAPAVPAMVHGHAVPIPAVPAMVHGHAVPIPAVPVPPYNPDNNTPPGIQPAELLLNINIWDWEIGLP
ncbi:unnamed protein product [Rotaria sp. Silwood2]|nr:unnamed protein product [Rotaria sp. Silwood2]CAF2540512.1 unnamed protein product [Rotaria sp. Silwood2]CAF2792038.1 unnamed protein product [Rotaria sp. Silwood2]CAF2919713.1 unnamed protein product [Rotaria sp. Silwood2]CAF4194215.1 unnamed protein product [Rotaria sp. Silwood2]